MKREFTYIGLKLADPNLKLTVEEVRSFYSGQYRDATRFAKAPAQSPAKRHPVLRSRYSGIALLLVGGKVQSEILRLAQNDRPITFCGIPLTMPAGGRQARLRLWDGLEPIYHFADSRQCIRFLLLIVQLEKDGKLSAR